MKFKPIRYFAFIMAHIFLSLFSLRGFGESQESVTKKECDREIQKKIVEGVKRGDAHSYFKYGQYTYWGVCFEKNVDQSFLFFYKAAEQGHIAASYNVALMYHLGIGVNKDIAKAFQLLGTLIEIDYRPAYNYVCDAKYEFGFDVDSLIDKYKLKCKT